jgi:hypothetical protein
MTPRIRKRKTENPHRFLPENLPQEEKDNLKDRATRLCSPLLRHRAIGNYSRGRLWGRSEHPSFSRHTLLFSACNGFTLSGILPPACKQETKSQ